MTIWEWKISFLLNAFEVALWIFDTFIQWKFVFPKISPFKLKALHQCPTNSSQLYPCPKPLLLAHPETAKVAGAKSWWEFQVPSHKIIHFRSLVQITIIEPFSPSFALYPWWEHNFSRNQVSFGWKPLSTVNVPTRITFGVALSQINIERLIRYHSYFFVRYFIKLD